MVWRGLTIAQRASTDYGLFLAAGLTLLLGVPVSLMMAGLLGLVPLTGVVTPFLSYGGSAMLANFAAVGALSSIRSDTQPRGDVASLRRQLGWAGGFMATVSVVLLIALVRVQIVRADEIVARPHLGMQADGSRRYQYNPRVLDVARQIPRGRVLDRRGVPLAVETAAEARTARADYQRLGISLDVSCPDAAARCYPIGGRMFHLIGDARSRAELGRVEYRIRRAGRRSQAARIRRSPNDDSDDRSRRAAGLGSPSRLPRSHSGLAASISAHASVGESRY